MRLVYLDESQNDLTSPVLCVAGVIVHGDKQWPEIDRRILGLIDKYIEPEYRQGFIFRATDIFHGSKYFDRRNPKWANYEKSRLPILFDLHQILYDLQLPVVVGRYYASEFGKDVLPEDTAPNVKLKMMHELSICDCLSQADKWLEKYAPTELAIAVHEDGVDIKSTVKRTVRLLRSEASLATNLPRETIEELGLPLRRIIDTIHFAEKADARPLQLADFCAFIFGRFFKQKPVPMDIMATLVGASHLLEVFQRAAEKLKASGPDSADSA